MARGNLLVEIKERAARGLLIAVIRRHEGRLRYVAENLGLPRRHVSRELRRYGVSVSRALAGEEKP